MRRRDFLRMAPALPALAEVPRLRGAKIRITDVRLFRTRVIRDTGTIVNWVGIPNAQRVGGTSFIEVHTDQGLVGLGPTVTESEVASLKNLLVGKDPFDIERLAAQHCTCVLSLQPFKLTSAVTRHSPIPCHKKINSAWGCSE